MSYLSTDFAWNKAIEGQEKWLGKWRLIRVKLRQKC